MSDTQTPEQYSQTPTLSPGEQLQREREKLNFSIEEIAEALHLRPAVIIGLEQDNYDEIPVPTYRRGYLRAYAKYVNIDEARILDAYQARFGNQETVERKVAPVSVKKPPSRIAGVLFKLVTLAVILGLIAVTVMWWQSRGGGTPPGLEDSSALTVEEGTDTNTESGILADEGTRSENAETAMNPSDDPMPTAQANAPADATDSPSTTLSEMDTALSSTDADTVSQDTQQPAIEDTTNPSANDGQASAEPTGEDITREEEPQEASSEIASTDAADENTGEAISNRLELTFNQQSWTEIYDASNQRVFVGLQEPGTSASVDGEPPYRLTIGNSTGVELRYQGEVVDLGERAGANNVARFTLGE